MTPERKEQLKQQLTPEQKARILAAIKKRRAAKAQEKPKAS